MLSLSGLLWIELRVPHPFLGSEWGGIKKKKVCCVLKPITCECDLIWKLDLYRFKQVVLIGGEESTILRQRHRRQSLKTERETGDLLSQAKESGTTEIGRGEEGPFPRGLNEAWLTP